MVTSESGSSLFRRHAAFGPRATPPIISTRFTLIRSSPLSRRRSQRRLRLAVPPPFFGRRRSQRQPWQAVPPPHRPSVVSETSDGAAVRARPLDSVTGHAPEIFFHTVRTDHKTTGAGPAKSLLLRAGGANILFRPSPSSGAPEFVLTVHFRFPRIKL